MKSELEKGKAQLIEELEEMRQKVSELEGYKTSYLASVRELREDEEKLRLMFESVTDGITVTDLNGVITGVNKAILRLGGFGSEQEVIGKSAFESIALRDRERALADMMELIGQDTVGTRQYYLLRTDGSEYPAEISAGLLKDATGNPAGFVSVIRDIAERKQVEELFQTISLRSPVGVYIVQDGKFVFANPWLLASMGFSEDEFLATDPLVLVHPEDREMVQQRTVEMLDGTRTVPYEFRAIDMAGETRWFMEALTPIQYRGEPAFLGSAIDITECRRAEETFQSISLRSPVGMYIVQDGKFVFANPQLLSDFGVAEERLLNVQPLSRVRPEDREMVRRNAIDMLKGRRTTPYEYGVTNRRGETRWFIETVVPIQYQGKRAVLGNLLNITERKRAEEALRESEDKYKRLVELAPDAIISVDENGIVTSCNQAFAQQSGYDKQEILGKYFTDLPTMVSPENTPVYDELFSSLASGEDFEPFEFPWTHKDGTSRWGEVNATVMLADGQFKGAQAIMRDITERKQAEERLRVSRRRFRDLVNLLPLGVYEIDKNYTVTFANRQALEVSGYTEEEVNAAPLNALQVCVPEDRQRMESNIQRIMNGEKSSGIEYTYLRKDGSTYPVITYSAPIVRRGKTVGLRGVSIDVTEQKKVEEEHRVILKTALDGFWMSDLEGRFLEVNDSYCEMIGYTRAELLKMSVADIEAVEEPEAVAQRIRKIIESGADRFESRHRRKDGEIIDVEVSVNYRDVDEGRLFVFIRDITERKQAERALRESEERYRGLAESITDVFFAFNSELRYTYWNKASEKLTGVPAQDALGKHLYDIFPQAAQTKQVEQVYLRALRTKQPQSFVNKYKFDGRDFVFEISAYPSGDGLAVFTKDITERKQAEEALLESEAKYRILVENSQDSIVILDFNGTIQMANEASTWLSGYSLSEGISMNIAEIIAPAYREEVMEKLKKVESGGPVPYFETDIRRKDGAIITVEACAQAISRDGEAVGAQVIARDITERKQIEEERQRIERLESLGTLAGGIAHDFNNILTGIMGNIGLALRHMEPEEKATQRLLEAEKATLRARDLTQQLLTFSKGGALMKKNVATGPLVEESASFALRGSNVDYELSVPHDIWPVYVDEGQVSSVIHNLVINADEAMPEGGTIKIGARNRNVGLVKLLPLPRGNYVEVTVEDCGVGIPKEYLGRIFEPYFTTKQKGSGLGLAAAYSIVKNHGGYITVESKLGAGTTFHVFLPASKETSPVEEEIGDDSSAVGSGRILVMDDEEPIRQLLQRALTEIGYEVLLTGDGEEAIEQYAKAIEAGEPFDVVILDLTVPGKMGGRETINKLLEIDPDVRAIASSGYSMDPVISDFRDHGFSGVIVKPYRISELRKTLQAVVLGKRG